jgi:exonuclease SbcD
MSRSEVIPNWIKVDTRPQISTRISIDKLSDEISALSEKIKQHNRKPVVEIKITGDLLDLGFVQTQISRLTELTLRCFWKHISSEQNNGSVFIERPIKIEEEMYRIAKDILGSTELANFAINELLPHLSKGNIEEANATISENFVQFKKGLKNATIS